MTRADRRARMAEMALAGEIPLCVLCRRPAKWVVTVKRGIPASAETQYRCTRHVKLLWPGYSTVRHVLGTASIDTDDPYWWEKMRKESRRMRG